MNEIIHKIIDQINTAEENNEELNDVSWGMQEGILISVNDAKELILYIDSLKS